MSQTYTTKDIARELQVDVRTVKRWWKKHRVPPDACTRNRCHRWSEEAKNRLLKKACQSGRIRLPEPREPMNQLKFNFDAKQTKPTFPKHFTHPPAATVKGPRAPRRPAAAQ